jgi:hypothetical protein
MHAGQARRRGFASECTVPASINTKPACCALATEAPLESHGRNGRPRIVIRKDFGAPLTPHGSRVRRKGPTSCQICNIDRKNRLLGPHGALSALRDGAAWIWSSVRMAGDCSSCWPDGAPWGGNFRKGATFAGTWDRLRSSSFVRTSLIRPGSHEKNEPAPYSKLEVRT